MTALDVLGWSFVGIDAFLATLLFIFLWKTR